MENRHAAGVGRFALQWVEEALRVTAKVGVLSSCYYTNPYRERGVKDYGGRK